MKIIAPDYFLDFSCLAGKCQHSCCVGWDIGIDRDTAEKYKSMHGPLEKKMKTCIKYSDEKAFFILDDEGRCPFLNDDNLCEIVLNCGEECLPRICNVFPSFMRSFSDRYEVNMRLSCEEACRIILSRDALPEYVELRDDGQPDVCSKEDELFFAKRDSLIAGISELTDSCIHTRLNPGFLISILNPAFPPYSLYHKEWIDKLNLLEKFKEEIRNVTLPDELSKPFEQLTAYLIYLCLQSKDGYLELITEYVSLLKDVCRAEMCLNGSCSLQFLIEAVREWYRFTQSEATQIINELQKMHE